MADIPQFTIFKTVFYYSVFILLAPISTFFIAKIFLLESIIGASTITSNVWAAVLAIAVLHVALGLFIYRAYSDAGKTPTQKDDKID